ncbi:MAG TPA: hypothetical protein PK054_10045 [Anaerohalosphaeraceae bacterium]|nr:hypothetical protein [Anaerohalosphaeraceae bacterium]HOL89060.1 hypothetical protein [Anaerohalosphaeraceae bacterium]HPP56906.1 hypothetical protein [Anaerohalosphaeraceae bacterium]
MKRVFFFLTAGVFASFAQAVVPTEAVTAVRTKAESATAISEQDKAEIDKFILATLNGIFLAEQSEEMAKTRRQIVEQKGTKDLSLYATAYVTILRDRLRSLAQTSLERIDDPARRRLVRLNLAILIAELRSLLLTEFGVLWSQDEDAVVRYWAVKSLTDPEIAKQLNSETTADPEATQKIFETLRSLIQKEPLPEILALTAGFAAAWQDARSGELLEQLTARRLNDYTKCQEKSAWVDGRILTALTEKYVSAKVPEEKTAAGRRFVLLLSAVMQRWLQNEAAGGKNLSEEARTQLITVLAETEDRLLPKLEISAAGIRRAFERSGGLQPVYEELMGTVSRRGTLPARLGVDFGRDADGRPLTVPPTLPNCFAAPAAPAAG